jgi:hypothetical protein
MYRACLPLAATLARMGENSLRPRPNPGACRRGTAPGDAPEHEPSLAELDPMSGLPVR